MQPRFLASKSVDKMEGEVWTSESDLDDLNPKQVKARAVGSKRLLDGEITRFHSRSFFINHS